MVRRQIQRRGELRIMPVNVARSSSAQDIALTHAQENQIDIRSKSHHGFETFFPVSTWLSRPRAITHIRRHSHLKQYHMASNFFIDFVQSVISHGDNKKITIWNFYNAPTGSIGAGEDLATDLGCPGTPCFVGGDFNLRHPIWDSSATFTLRLYTDLIDWYEIKGLRLLNLIGIPIHDRCGTIDLAFYLEDSAYCENRPHLHSTSDHETFVTTIHWDFSSKKQAKLIYKDLDQKIFVRLLGNNHRPSSISSRDDLETEARAIIETIHTSLVGACHRNRSLNHGTPWLNEDCRSALYAYRRLRREGHGILEDFSLKNVCARLVTGHVRRLCNITRGISPGLLRQSTLFYRAETWYGSQTSQWALNQVQLAINRAVRAVVPVYKTFPIPVLLRETVWGLANAWLDRIHDRLVVRIAVADPLRRRWNSEQFNWIGATGRETGFSFFEHWTRFPSPLDFVVYSDGSIDESGMAGAGYCVYRGSQELLYRRIPLGRNSQVYDAEVLEVVSELRTACFHWMARFARNVFFCLDNDEAAIRLHTDSPTPSRSTRIQEFQSLRRKRPEREISAATDSDKRLRSRYFAISLWNWPPSTLTYIFGGLQYPIPTIAYTKNSPQALRDLEKVPQEAMRTLNGPNTSIPKLPKEQPDDRLSLRLLNKNSLRLYSGFALLPYIKSKLGADKELITNILQTKIGSALCPSKKNTKNLKEKIAARKVFPWTSYRLPNAWNHWC
ncbi:hypothetical protein EPUL_002613 [Erysiphe pulchra]|uniref:Endonuclease/exonuclease/phosphatase domain-containing protein n=1 Tax=Erysiphe pulchra TaxID=225359 RepID=A0A2S4PPE4_9PEZI|nr:hypothetical protein EPUL_002613 [Erysiphe pulchra]